MLHHLMLCHASMADQCVDVEHIIMDGGSTDGTVEAFQGREDVFFLSERDNGMYHALNKAINASHGEIIGHLNSDEQYLPGTLQYVLTFFAENPNVDFVAGDFIVVDSDGEFVAFRKTFQPRWPYFFSNYLYTTTCTLFYRRKIFDVCRFDESYRSIADVIFLYDVLKKGFKGRHVKRYFSTFTYSGNNLSLSPISAKEKKRFNSNLPLWYRFLKPVFVLLFFVERILNGTYWEQPVLQYSIFSRMDLSQRRQVTKVKPGFRLRFRPITDR